MAQRGARRAKLRVDGQRIAKFFGGIVPSVLLAKYQP